MYFNICHIYPIHYYILHIFNVLLILFITHYQHIFSTCYVLLYIITFCNALFYILNTLLKFSRRLQLKEVKRGHSSSLPSHTMSQVISYPDYYLQFSPTMARRCCLVYFLAEFFPTKRLVVKLWWTEVFQHPLTWSGVGLVSLLLIHWLNVSRLNTNRLNFGGLKIGGLNVINWTSLDWMFLDWTSKNPSSDYDLMWNTTQHWNQK